MQPIAREAQPRYCAKGSSSAARFFGSSIFEGWFQLIVRNGASMALDGKPLLHRWLRGTARRTAPVRRVGRTGFAVGLECEMRGGVRVYDCDIEVEEVHLAVPMLVKFGWVDAADGVPCHSNLMSFAFPSFSRMRHSSVEESDQMHPVVPCRAPCTLRRLAASLGAHPAAAQAFRGPSIRTAALLPLRPVVTRCGGPDRAKPAPGPGP